MTPERALKVMMRQAPCLHETLDTRIGDGTTWARCEDCGRTVERARLADMLKRANEFYTAIEVLRPMCEDKA